MSFWSQFGAIYCINLKERIDRRQSATAVFEKLRIPVQFHTAIRDVGGNGARGCWKEHQACMRKSYDAGHDNALIFEDDLETNIIPSQSAQDVVTAFLKTANPSWEIVFLG